MMTVTPTVVGNAVTLAGDSAADTLFLGVDTGGVITWGATKDNAGALTLHADANVAVQLDGGANSVILDKDLIAGLKTNAGSVTVTGGTDIDTLQAAGNWTINGADQGDVEGVVSF